MIGQELFLWLIEVVIHTFFREVQVRGSYNIPKSGATIIVIAPHANQFLDAILTIYNVYRNTNGRWCAFVEAAVSFRRLVVGFLSRCAGALPVERAQDLLEFKDQGEITFEDYDSDPTLIKGINTHFTKTCMVKGLIGLPNSLGNAQILEIIDDKHLKLSKTFQQSKAIELLSNNKTSKFKSAPKIDNSKIFKAVFHHLHDGGVIAIAPEGGSHDRTELLPFKPGVAIMALGAVAEKLDESNKDTYDPNFEVKIVPCGMNYFHAHKFRSRAVFDFGKPIIVTAQDGKEYKENSRKKVGELLEQITEAVKSVTIQSPDYETLMTIQAARRLYTQNKKLPLSKTIQINRNMLTGYSKFKDDPKIKHLKESVLNYNRKLFELGIRDHQVENATENKFNNFILLLSRLSQLIIFFVLSLPGVVLFSPVFIATSIISHKKQKQALKASSVKIKAKDVIGSWKVLVGLVLAPLLYLTYSIIGTFIIIFKLQIINYSLFNLIFVFILNWAFFVLMTYSSLKTGEVGMDILKSISPLAISLTSNSNELKDLQNERKNLSFEVTEVVNELGPKVFPHLKSLNVENLSLHRQTQEEKDAQEIAEDDEYQRRVVVSTRMKRSNSEVSLESGFTDLASNGESSHTNLPNLSNISIFPDVLQMRDSSGDSSESESHTTGSSSLRRSPSISVDSNFSSNSWVNLKQNQSGSSSATASGSGNIDLNEASILNRIRKGVIERNKEEEEETFADNNDDGDN